MSLRGPSTIYKISGQNGTILWRLGGKASDFQIGDGAEFYYQASLVCRSSNSRLMSLSPAAQPAVAERVLTVR